MAVFEVTDKTVLKILVRRGLDSERQEVRLDEGELGYTIDTKRLFVGDGLGGGGNVVGNIYQGTVSDAFTVLSIVPGIQYGDLMYDQSESTLYVVNDEEATELFDIGPRYEENVLEKTTSDIGLVRIAEPCLGKFNLNDGVGDRRKAFFLDYTIQEPFYKTNKVIEMNTHYWAITSGTGFNPNVSDGSFYFGDIKGITTLNPLLLSSRINIDVSDPADRISKALTIWGLNGKVISFGNSGEIGNSTGQTDIIGLSGIAFHPNTDSISPTNPLLTTKMFFAADGTAQFLTPGGNVVTPKFNVNGFSKFNDDMQIAGNLVVQGNLSAFGDFSVFETFLTTGSALSVINYVGAPYNSTAFYVEQKNSDQNVVMFHPDTYSRIFLMDDDGDFLMGRSIFYGTGKGSNSESDSPNIDGSAGGSNTVISTNFYVRDGKNGSGVRVNNEFSVNVRGKNTLIGQSTCAFDNDGGHMFTKGFTTHDNVLFQDQNNPSVNWNLARDDTANSIVNIFADTASSGNQCGLTIRGRTNSNQNSSLLYIVDNNRNSAGNASNRAIFVGALAGGGGSDIEKFSVRSNGDMYALGNFYATGDIVAFYSSDVTVKENIKVIESPLEKINKIKGVTFNWNDEYSEKLKTKNDIGVIAQDVEQVLPETVITRESGIKAVNYDKLIPLLIESVKELSRKIDNLEKK